MAGGQNVANVNNLVRTYGKPVMICEFGFFEDEPDITRELLTTVIKGCEALPDNQGLGVFYWEPECSPQRYGRGAWQANGRPSPSLDAFAEP